MFSCPLLPTYTIIYLFTTYGVILTGQTRLRFGSVRFTLVYFGRMRGKNHYVSFGSIWRLFI